MIKIIPTNKIFWINFLHIYQPPYQSPEIINQVVKECYSSLVKMLKENPKSKTTINISGSLVEHLINTRNEKIIEDIKELVRKKQVELTGSGCYHPILPLLSEKEIVRQIKLNDEILKRAFGRLYNPKGFYLPEMAYSKKVAKIIKKMGFSWIILDEINFNGKLNKVDFNKKYKIKGVGLNIIFRNRTASKSFVPETVAKEAEKTAPPKFIITATDGEMYGHHHKSKNNSEETLDSVLKNNKVQTITVKKYFKMLPSRAEAMDPIAASWETTEKDVANHNPFPLWHDPKNRIHRLLWDLRRLAIRIINQNINKPNYEWARHHLDRGLSSCAWWWASEKKPDAFSPITWNPDEIEKGIKELISSIRSLTNVSPKTKLRAEKIYQQLIKEIWSRHWKKYNPSIFSYTKKQLGLAFYLLDEKYLIRLFTKKIKKEIAKRGKIVKINIETFKNHIGSKTSYHIVARYVLNFSKNNESLGIFCNANSRESRRGTYEALKYIWDNGFNQGAFHSSQPLFYHERLKAVYYLEMPGNINLYQMIARKEHSLNEIKGQVKLAAGWLQRLHNLPTKKAKNFNPSQSRVETIIPGPAYFLKRISERHPDYPQLKIKIEKLFNIINDLEKKNLETIKKTIIHGDCHPENIIIYPYGKNSIGIIDFTDTCLADFTRDLGNFLQQLDWMSKDYLSEKQINQLKKLFLDSYFKEKKISQDIKNRLSLYQAWTALRSAIFFLTIRDFDISRANRLIKETKWHLKNIKK